MLVSRTEAEGMDVCADSKAERSECRSKGDVQGRAGRRGAESKALVTDVTKVHHSADGPSCQPPHLRMIRGNGEGDADDRVASADNRRDEPGLPS